MCPRISNRPMMPGWRAARSMVLTAVLSSSSFLSLAETPADIAAAQVFAVERAFARTMADRDLEAFSGFVSEEAIFFSGTTALRGKAQITGEWKAYFADPAPPFAWDPDQVEALDSGTLALSTGPVLDATGKVIGRFNSIWRLEGPGVWRIVFDKGGPPSPGPQ